MKMKKLQALKLLEKGKGLFNRIIYKVLKLTFCSLCFQALK